MNKKQISQKQYSYLSKFKDVLTKNRVTATKNICARGTGFIDECFDYLEKTLQEYLNENSSHISKKDANVFVDKLVAQIKMRTQLTGCQNRVNVAKELINNYEFKSIKQTLITLVKKVWLFILSIIVAS